ncbi:MAG: hypothetical protein CV088_05045 [Nitrospira sp. LK70]|nr:hypothetical protein [Nitrospira sp. LK70]
MRRAGRRVAIGLLAAVIGLAEVAAGSTAAPATGEYSLRAAVHVHSTMSTGSLSLESLARRAEDQQLDVLILSENFTLRYDYGLRPLEGFLKYHVAFPSVMEYGVERFLDEVRAVRHRHPNLIIIPGVEVAPHYHWTGSLLRGDLTMHNAQRNLLVIGLETPEDYEQLPALGNSCSFVWGRQSVVNGLPLLLLVPAVWLWKPHGSRGPDWRECPSRLRPVLAVVLVITCVILMASAWPMKTPVYGSHDGMVGYRPYQALIDRAVERGALVFWSMPEARDFSRHSFGLLGTVTIKTEPHPEALILTRGYTGFGGLYQDARRVIAPGGVWDQLLRSRSVDDQDRFPTLIGEVAFHGTTDAGKDLDRVYTVIQTSERTVAGILAALKSGRTYAVARGDQNILLRLDEFRLLNNGQSAGIGETLRGSGNGDIIVRVGVSAIDGKQYAVKLRVIRSGHVIRQIEGKTPLWIELADPVAQREAWMNYRVEVVGKGGELLTNPIYASPTGGSNTNVPRRMALHPGPMVQGRTATS